MKLTLNSSKSSSTMFWILEILAHSAGTKIKQLSNVNTLRMAAIAAATFVVISERIFQWSTLNYFYECNCCTLLPHLQLSLYTGPCVSFFHSLILLIAVSQLRIQPLLLLLKKGCVFFTAPPSCFVDRLSFHLASGQSYMHNPRNGRYTSWDRQFRVRNASYDYASCFSAPVEKPPWCAKIPVPGKRKILTRMMLDNRET